MRDAISERHVEEAVKHVFKDNLFFGVNARNARGVMIEASHILLGELVDHADIALFFRRVIEELPKGRNFIVRYDAVRLRHFR